MKLALAWVCCLCATLVGSVNGGQPLKFGEGPSGRRQLWRISPQTEEHVKVLQRYERQFEFWRPAKLGGDADVMVDTISAGRLKDDLSDLEIPYTVQMEDIDEVIHSQMREIERARLGRVGIMGLANFDYSIYHPYDEIQQWVLDMENEYSFVTRFELAKSYEGRSIGGFKLSAPAAANASNPRPAIWFEGGIHAREWISPATVMYFSNELCKKYNEGDARVERILGMFDFYIVPSLNVDGYSYTWENESNRLWRKTRKPNIAPGTNEDFGCMGTDPNRNWDALWAQGGESPWPCSLVFRGFQPFDNQEVKAVDTFIGNVMRDQNQNFKVFIDWHSYSQLILAPWSYSAEAELPPETDLQVGAAQAMAVAIKAVHGKVYQAGPSARLLYAASGAGNDYGFVGTPKATYSYTVELRDTGEYGFLLPADQILPTGEESYAAVLALCDFVIDNDYTFS